MAKPSTGGTASTRVLGSTCAEIHLLLSSLVLAARQATQRSAKFLRWLRASLRDRLAEATAVPRLQALYSVL